MTGQPATTDDVAAMRADLAEMREQLLQALRAVGILYGAGPADTPGRRRAPGGPRERGHLTVVRLPA